MTKRVGCMRMGMAAALFALSVAKAGAQEQLTVEVATFEQGRFVIAGSAPAGAEVRVDGTELFEVADQNGIFRIARRTVLPGCTIRVAAGDLSRDVAVANCREALLGVETPQPTTLLRPRGGWNSTRSYRADDVVDFQGRQWRSVKSSKGRQPGLASTTAFWSELDAGGLDLPAGTGDGAGLDEDALGGAVDDPAQPPG